MSWSWRDLDNYINWQFRKHEKRRENDKARHDAEIEAMAQYMADAIEAASRIEIYEQRPGQSVSDFLDALTDEEDENDERAL